jgi:hypothetical protein
MAGMMMHHRTTARNFAFSPKKPTRLDFTENRAQKCNGSDRMLGSARILGVQRGDLPDGVFLYIELFDFQI